MEVINDEDQGHLPVAANLAFASCLRDEPAAASPAASFHRAACSCCPPKTFLRGTALWLARGILLDNVVRRVSSQMDKIHAR